MTALEVAAIVFACMFAGALFGMFLSSVLPKEHLSENAKDVIKVTMAMLATLAARCSACSRLRRRARSMTRRTQ